MNNEGLRLEAYQDVVGVWTIGFGHTGAEVKRGLVITPDAAKSLLLSDAETAEKCVNNCVSGIITQGQFDALCSFVFNLGCTALRNSTLLRKLNSGDDVGAAEEFSKWNHAGGHIVAGLTKRRLEEKELFLT
jgi:lysozyme